MDNSIPIDTVCWDVDWLYIIGLVPYCDYCITQVGGIDCECNPTDLLLGWFDKLPELIYSADGGGPIAEYANLCLVADVHGAAIVVVTGSGDEDFDGLADSQQRAPVECPEAPPGHGVCGCWTLWINLFDYAGHGPGGDEDEGAGAGDTGGESGAEAQMVQALLHGDINMDGITNTADLGIMLGSFGWRADDGADTGDGAGDDSGVERLPR